VHEDRHHTHVTLNGAKRAHSYDSVKPPLVPVGHYGSPHIAGCWLASSSAPSQEHGQLVGYGVAGAPISRLRALLPSVAVPWSDQVRPTH
jgi:hypothetical protein